MEPYTHGFYSVMAADQTNAEYNSNYQGNYARLLDIKRQYDPGNLFRLNANITPS